MPSYRDGVKFGIMLAIKTFNTMPFVKALEGLMESYKKIESVIDENGNSIKKDEE